MFLDVVEVFAGVGVGVVIGADVGTNVAALETVDTLKFACARLCAGRGL